MSSIPVVRTAMIVAAVFVFDCLTPWGISAGALYLAAVLSSVAIEHDRAVFATAGICSALVIAAMAVSPGAGQTAWWNGLANCGLDLGTIWGSAYMADSWNRLQQRRRKQLQETRLLHQAIALSASQLSFRDALQDSLKTLCDILGWPVGHVYLRDAAGQHLVASEVWHPDETAGFGLLRAAVRGVRFAQGQGGPGRVWLTGEPIAVADVAQSPDYAWLTEPERLGVIGAFALPVTVGGKVAAVLEFFSERPISADVDFMALARNIGQQLGRLFERRKAELSLRQGEERLRMALVGGRMGTWDWDIDTGRVAWSPELERLHHLEPGTFEGTTAAAERAVHPDDREQVRAAIQRACDAEEEYRVEYRTIRPDGTVGWLEGRGAMHADAESQHRRLVGVCLDITERKEFEEQNARLAAIVQSSDDAILSKSLDGRILSWNGGAERIYGYTAEEALGQSIAMLAPGDRHDDFAEIMRRVTQGEHIEHYETRRRRKDGRLIDISLSMSPIRDAEGRIIGLSSVARDVTERKKAEQEMKQAREKAETASRQQSRFLANMSHELRTPMNAILGMLQLALSDDLTPRVRQWLATAKASADSLLTLLNDLLDLSKLDAGKLAIQPEPFSLRDLLDGTIRPLAVQAFEKRLELVCDVADETPDRIVGDAGRLRQVLTNLVMNAVKFTDEGEVVVSVDCAGRAAGAVHVRFSVIDTGMGISPHEQRRIFEPFIQSDATTTREHGGAGLGLSIASELVRRMGGELKVASEPDKGSRFWFSLPFEVEEDESREEELRAAEPLEGVPVLVVDGNATCRQLLAQMLRRWSMQADAAIDFDHALGKLYRAEMEERHYPLLIADASALGADAAILAERIAAVCKQAPALIVMDNPGRVRATGNAAPGDGLSRAVHLEKPCSARRVLEAVTAALGIASSARAEGLEPPFSARTCRPLSILLAEDTPANQQVVADALNRRGHRVAVAGNGKEALAMLEQTRFDVVLMDVAMPVMDGCQAASAIRHRERGGGRRIPIVALTAHALQADRQRCAEAGMDAYLAKPLDIGDLIRTVENAARGPNPPSPETESGPIEGRPAEAQAAAAADRRTAGGAVSELAWSGDPQDRIDYEGALKRLGGDPDMFRDVVRLFDEDKPGLLRAIREAAAARDAPGLRRAAHSLKGLASNFGAPRAVETAGRLEQIGASGCLDDADQAIVELESRLSSLDQILVPYRVPPTSRQVPTDARTP